jgi:hypothetical protein
MSATTNFTEPEASDSPAVCIAPAGEKGMGVFTTRDFKRGETVVIGKCISQSSERTIYTIQTDRNVHVMMDEPAVRINHSYTPNTGVRNNQWGAYDFVALEDIPCGSEIFFDYETTEDDLTSDFQQCCPPPPERSATTDRGFHSLPVSIRSRYGEFIADYLKSPAADS